MAAEGVSPSQGGVEVAIVAAQMVGNVGASIVIEDLVDNYQQTIVLVEFPEQVDSRRGRFSVHSPLGKALLGRKVGDIVEFDAPGGTQQIRIIAIG